MASVCDSFHANIWRPSICVNCYKPKSQHQSPAVRSRAGSTIVRAESSLSARKNTYQRNRRSRTVSPSPEESKLRELLSSRKMAVVEVGQMPALAGRLPTTLNMPVVGVVKPYAVVDIDAESPVEPHDGNHTPEEKPDASTSPRRHSVPNVKAHSTTIILPNKTLNGSTTSTAVHKTSAPTLSNDYFRRSSTPEYYLKEVEDQPLNSQSPIGSNDKNSNNHTDRRRRMRHGSVEPLEIRSSTSQAVSFTRSHSFRRNKFENSQGSSSSSPGVIIPKRKAPPPPPRLSSISNRTGPPRYSVASIASKMPPSSPHPIRRNSAATHHILPYAPVSVKQKEELQHIRTQSMMVLARPRAMTIANGDHDNCCRTDMSVVLRKDSTQIRQKRAPPEKPPRTLSTFISSEEQSELVCDLDIMDDNAITDSQQLVNGTTTEECQQPQSLFRHMVSIANGHMDELHSPNNIPKHRTLDFHSASICCLSKSVHIRGDCHASSQAGSSVITLTPMEGSHDQTYYMDIQSQISDVLLDTLAHVYERELGRMFCREDLWQVDKKDIKMATDNTANYKDILFSTQHVQLEDTSIKRLLEVCQLLQPHPNLSLIRCTLTASPSSSPPTLTTLLRDYTTGDLSSCILPLRESLTPEDYTELVLLCLVQLFSALKHLYNNGVCHRDVGLENLLVTKVGEHWLLRLGNFNFALHRPGPVTATTFIYGYHELQWLGGAGSRLPPEVMNTPENAQTVDYSHTDCFAVGCLIYELMGKQNPFERDTELIYYQYTDIDFPTFEGASSHAHHLQQLAGLLLKRDQNKRVSASTGLLICQALLWLPHSWLKEPVSEVALRYHLAMERTRLVSELAKREDSSVSLPLLLKADFLLNCVPLRTDSCLLSILTHYIDHMFY